jgi:hypothetical protein
MRNKIIFMLFIFAGVTVISAQSKEDKIVQVINGFSKSLCRDYNEMGYEISADDISTVICMYAYVKSGLNPDHLVRIKDEYGNTGFLYGLFAMDDHTFDSRLYDIPDADLRGIRRTSEAYFYTSELDNSNPALQIYIMIKIILDYLTVYDGTDYKTALLMYESGTSWYEEGRIAPKSTDIDRAIKLSGVK